jgi:hypothetical protein
LLDVRHIQQYTRIYIHQYTMSNANADPRTWFSWSSNNTGWVPTGINWNNNVSADAVDLEDLVDHPMTNVTTFNPIDGPNGPKPMELDEDLASQMQDLSITDQIKTINDLNNSFFKILPQSMVNMELICYTKKQYISKTKFDDEYEQKFLIMVDEYNRSAGRYVVRLQKEQASGLYSAWYLVGITRRKTK